MPLDRFEVTADQLATVRFAPSPGFETLRAVRYLLHPARAPRLHQAMLDRLHQRVPGTALHVLAAVVPARGFIPDFLGQPAHDAPDAWLTAAATTATSTVAAEVAEALHTTRVTPPVAWSEDSTAARDQLVDAIAEVWTSGMRSEWDRIEPVLRADIATRSRQWSRSGIADVLNGLHPRVEWDGTAIIRHDSPWAVTTRCTHGLVLSPSVLVWPRMAIADPPSGTAAIYYPALNASTPPDDTTRTALAALLGASRAAVLRHLATPARSIDISRALNLSPATVSHHVTILRDAGLILTSREGTEAWHAHTPLGAHLASWEES